MKDQLPINYYAKRITDQYDYMFEVATSDRSKERKEELLQSATDMLGVITRGAPREYGFELVFVVAAEAAQYAKRLYDWAQTPKPLAGIDFHNEILFKKRFT